MAITHVHKALVLGLEPGERALEVADPQLLVRELVLSERWAPLHRFVVLLQRGVVRLQPRELPLARPQRPRLPPGGGRGSRPHDGAPPRQLRGLDAPLGVDLALEEHLQPMLRRG